MKKLILTLIATAALAGCKADNPALTGLEAPPPAYVPPSKMEITADGLVLTYDLRVDILLVIDDSKSMKNHQENLSRNFKSFVNELAKIEAIDFHIGYTLAHDRERYGSVVPQTCPDGRVNWETVGSLRPLAGANLPTDGRRFVSREDDFVSILTTTLNPVENPSLSKDLLPSAEQPDVCGYGPEKEELFQPVVSLLRDKSLELGPNKGFRREGALFVAILFSDAKSADVKYGLTPHVVNEILAQETGSSPNKRRYRVLSVAMKPGTQMTGKGGACYPDPEFGTPLPSGASRITPRVVEKGENPLAELAQLTQDETNPQDQVLSICKPDYADDLVRLGTQIQQDTLRDVELVLPGPAQVFDFDDPQTEGDDRDKNLKVLLGDTPLEKGELWTFNSQTGVITVFAQKIDWANNPGKKIRVQFVPIDQQSILAKPWTGG